MTYTTTQDIINYIGEDRIVKLTSFINDTDAYLEETLNQAEAKVEGYCARYYSIPLPTDNYMIKNWTLRFATKEVFKHSVFDKIPEKYKTDFAEMVVEIQDMAKGVLTIVGGSPVSETGASLDITTNVSLMDETSLKGF